LGGHLFFVNAPYLGSFPPTLSIFFCYAFPSGTPTGRGVSGTSSRRLSVLSPLILCVIPSLPFLVPLWDAFRLPSTKTRCPFQGAPWLFVGNGAFPWQARTLFDFPSAFLSAKSSPPPSVQRLSRMRLKPTFPFFRTFFRFLLLETFCLRWRPFSLRQYRDDFPGEFLPSVRYTSFPSSGTSGNIGLLARIFLLPH